MRGIGVLILGLATSAQAWTLGLATPCQAKMLPPTAARMRPILVQETPPEPVAEETPFEPEAEKEVDTRSAEYVLAERQRLKDNGFVGFDFSGTPTFPPNERNKDGKNDQGYGASAAPPSKEIPAGLFIAPILIAALTAYTASTGP